MKSKLFFAVLAVAVTVAGCNERTHEGVELGNPDISVTSFRIVEEDGRDVYEVVLADPLNAVITRNSTSETLSVPFGLINNTLTLNAGFSDGRRITVTTTFDDGGAIESGQLRIDGQNVPACFEIPGVTPECGAPAETATELVKETETPSDEQAPLEERIVTHDGPEPNIETPDWQLDESALGGTGHPPGAPLRFNGPSRLPRPLAIPDLNGG